MDFKEFMEKRTSPVNEEPKHLTGFEEFMAEQNKAKQGDFNKVEEAPNVITVGENPPPPVPRSKFKGDWAYIAGKEGGLQQEGYIPMQKYNYRGEKDKKILPVIGNSGVTVGEGVDLGQVRPELLEKATITDDLKEKLKPYIGKTRVDAVEALKNTPLSLNKEEAYELTNAFKKIYLDDDVMHLYEKGKREGAPEFSDLPTEIQTVLADMGWHMGAGGGGFTRKALDKAGDGNFKGIINVLEDSIREERESKNRRWFKERRRQEIDMLEDFLDKENTTSSSSQEE